MTILNVEVPATEYTVQPCPEDHLSFSMKLMVMALQLYQDKVEKSFCPYVQYAYDKLTQFVDSRKEMTQRSYWYFCEHAYNQFFVHEAFHQLARARTKAKEIGADTPLHSSTKLDGYAWIQDHGEIKHVPKERLQDDELPEYNEDEHMQEEETEDVPVEEEPAGDEFKGVPVEEEPADETMEAMLDVLKVEEEPEESSQQKDEKEPNREEVPDPILYPKVSVKIRKEEPGVPDDKTSGPATPPAEGACSPSGEVVPGQLDQQDQAEEEEPMDIYVYYNNEDCWGQFMISHLRENHVALLRRLVFITGRAVDDGSRPLPQTPDDIYPFSLGLFMEVVQDMTFPDFMNFVYSAYW